MNTTMSDQRNQHEINVPLFGGVAACKFCAFMTSNPLSGSRVRLQPGEQCTLGGSADDLWRPTALVVDSEDNGGYVADVRVGQVSMLSSCASLPFSAFSKKAPAMFDGDTAQISQYVTAVLINRSDRTIRARAYMRGTVETLPKLIPLPTPPTLMPQEFRPEGEFVVRRHVSDVRNAVIGLEFFQESTCPMCKTLVRTPAELPIMLAPDAKLVCIGQPQDTMLIESLRVDVPRDDLVVHAFRVGRTDLIERPTSIARFEDVKAIAGKDKSTTLQISQRVTVEIVNMGRDTLSCEPLITGRTVRM